MEPEITVDSVRMLAKAVGITLPEEDVEPVTAALRGYKAAFRAIEALDLSEVDPVLTMDPRWKS